MTDLSDLNLANPGPRRFWHGVHNPSNAKYPMVLELREQTIERDTIQLGFSKIIAKQPVIADPIQLREAAESIIARAGRVDEFVGIIGVGS